MCNLNLCKNRTKAVRNTGHNIGIGGHCESVFISYTLMSE
uniref:Uncharacterized protein n=2 Tax=Vibrionaceae TaxID=641 RepID=A0A0H3ZYH2_ALIFS|nr:hypothetical protein [Vibrio tasmaniensis]AKN38475.1 hypothetical protein [Aliivibrio fischeri]AKN38511.1 hypothetical protein [Aliivibrio fischeri]